jgi:hypothetical protein
MTPTDAQIEAAARILHKEMHGDFIERTWENEHPSTRDEFTELAKAALTATAEVGPNKTPASRKLLNITEAMWRSAEQELKEVRAAEREACARIFDGKPRVLFSKNVAAAIRTRKE